VSNTKKVFAFALIIGLLLFLLYALWPYIGALFGAIILYVIFSPMYRALRKRGLPPTWAASTVIAASILIVLIPLFVFSWLVIGQLGSFMQTASELGSRLDGTRTIGDMEIGPFVDRAVAQTQGFVAGAIAGAVSEAARIFATLLIMYFLLYYMLVHNRMLTDAVRKAIPFNNAHTEILLQEVRNVTHAAVLSTAVIALIQGTMIALGFWALGIKGALLLGAVAAFLSFLPVMGTALVWLPVGIVHLAANDYATGIGVLALGAATSTIDNFIRPTLQRRVGELHPLMSVVGVFIGVPYFGILGLVIGPLMLSYFMLTIQMFREEYVAGDSYITSIAPHMRPRKPRKAR
jgi:predicted PurR-regulated permease PerM